MHIIKSEPRGSACTYASRCPLRATAHVHHALAAAYGLHEPCSSFMHIHTHRPHVQRGRFNIYTLIKVTCAQLKALIHSGAVKVFFSVHPFFPRPALRKSIWKLGGLLFRNRGGVCLCKWPTQRMRLNSAFELDLGVLFDLKTGEIFEWWRANRNLVEFSPGKLIKSASEGYIVW